MNICITGALGHIGSKLIRNLSISFLNDIYLVDNFLTQRYPSLFELPEGKNYIFYEMDVLSDDFIPILKNSDVIVHLAAVTNAEASFYNKDIVEKINVKGIERIANLCAEYRKSLIFFSSTSVYGVQTEIVDENCKETDLKPQSPYAESKLFGERLLKELSKKYGLNFVIFRLGTIFGYSIGMRFHTAVNKFIWQAVTGQEITVWKTALNQKRPYCGLNDCINAINYVINNNIFDREIYNIVTINLTVGDIINVIKKFVPNIKVKFVDSPIMNQLSYNVSNVKSLKKGFVYNDNLEESVKETISKLKNINFKILKRGLD